MRRVVEKTAGTFEEAVRLAVEDLGLPPEQVQIVLLRTRDLDPSVRGPEEYTVRAFRRCDDDLFGVDYEDLNLEVPRPLVCESSADTFDEAVQMCLNRLGIDKSQADVQMLQREDLNPLRPGPERISVRVWRRRLKEPAPDPDAPGAKNIHDVHAAAHLPADEELSFETPEKEC